MKKGMILLAMTFLPGLARPDTLNRDFLNLGSFQFAAQLTGMGASIHSFSLSCYKRDGVTSCELFLTRLVPEACTTKDDTALPLEPESYRYSSASGVNDLDIQQIGDDGLMLKFRQIYEFKSADTQLMLHLHRISDRVIGLKSLTGVVNGFDRQSKLRTMQYEILTQPMTCRAFVAN